MPNLRTVRVPLLERVVLEELANRWEVSTDEALGRLIRQAARQEVVSQTESLPDRRAEAQALEGVRCD